RRPRPRRGGARRPRERLRRGRPESRHDPRELTATSTARRARSVRIAAVPEYWWGAGLALVAATGWGTSVRLAPRQGRDRARGGRGSGVGRRAGRAHARVQRPAAGAYRRAEAPPRRAPRTGRASVGLAGA